jgi:regulator of protease activity HflC (stomatin/prohibitin superfamily)
VNVAERELKLGSGWVGLAVIAGTIGLIAVLLYNAVHTQTPFLALVAGVMCLLPLLSLFGFIINGPNTARVVQLFGNYVGTLKDTGFFWANPFYATTKVSLRVRSFETGVSKTEEVKDATGKVIAAGTSTRKPLKVNDKDGTPIEIAAVVVWKVIDPTTAVFQVDDYEEYVTLQADSALRGLACRYSYDAPETDIHSLRGHIDEVAEQLRKELHTRMLAAGVDVIESRISFLAYAPEIAAAMLQRQQAGAVVAARRLIVDAAVGMVEHALDELQKRNVVELDSERKAAMVSNLLVVLCSHQAAAPVVNAGTLYN